jgi:hypothetical protein
MVVSNSNLIILSGYLTNGAIKKYAGKRQKTPNYPSNPRAIAMPLDQGRPLLLIGLNVPKIKVLEDNSNIQVGHMDAVGEIVT